MGFESPKQPLKEEMMDIEKEKTIAEEDLSSMKEVRNSSFIGETLVSNESIKDIEALQTEEKGFLSKIRKSAQDVFHFTPKENFKKIMRTFALATVLLAPVGEKAFAERAEGPKEQTVAMAQLDQGVVKEDFETQEAITRQREIIKEKYDTEIIGDNLEYTLEELKDFEDALEKVQNFAPEKFAELKIVLVKANTLLFDMKVCVNLCEELNTIEDIKSNNNGFDLLLALLKLEKDNEDTIDEGYDVVIIGSDKKELEKEAESNRYKDRINIASSVTNIHKKDMYKDILIHELSHLLTLNDTDMYEKLSDEFKNIDREIKSSKIIKHSVDSKNNLDRYQGFVSAYAGVGGQGGLMYGYSDEYEYHEGMNMYEDTAETINYMINDYHYADYDPIVQEKIKVLKNFLNENSNE